jgi:hypothetical protein
MEVENFCECEEGGEIELLSMLGVELLSCTGSFGRVRERVPEAPRISRGDFWKPRRPVCDRITGASIRCLSKATSQGRDTFSRKFVLMLQR